MAMKLKYLVVPVLAAWGVMGDAQGFTLAIINNNPTVDPSERLVSSSPYEKQVLHTPPDKVSLTFSQPVRPEKSSIRVLDMYGSQVDDGELNNDGLSISVG